MAIHKPQETIELTKEEVLGLIILVSEVTAVSLTDDARRFPDYIFDSLGSNSSFLQNKLLEVAQ